MKQNHRGETTAHRIEEGIREFVATSPDNTLRNGTVEKAWAEPLVGFSSGDDPLYLEFKEHVGPFHLTPAELFNATFPSAEVAAAELSVVSWVLPQTEATLLEQRKETAHPSERWARSRVHGEAFNRKLHGHVVQALRAEGCEAVAPCLSPLWSLRVSDRYGMASTWSERHAAHACGLGTFGLCDGLITPKGKAMRCGSVVVRSFLPPTPRPYLDHRAWCLFYSRGTCKRCIRRCPAGAISERGHDKGKCREYLFPGMVDYVKSAFGLEGYACGLCQTGVPCETRIPADEST